ncbi:MAG: hypothetical protein DRO01_03015 [Thermoproteota archaeon]|nr:MAG: hypothetical protein DRO01_03015 [Candidatus Korarchaeota archaeon]
MVRFVHLADAHLGRRQYGLEERERDFLEAFNEAVDRTIQARPEFVAFSGDLFDSYRPSPTTLVSAFVGLKRIVDSGVRVFAVAGNHDLGPVPGGGRSSPLPLFEKALEGGLVNLSYSRPVERLDGVFVAGLPYTPRQEAEALKSALDAISRRVQVGSAQVVLILHQAVKPLVPPQKAEIDRAVLDRLAFSYYAMGHVHDRNFPRRTSQRRPIAYSGSLEVVEEREADKLEVYGKGFYVVELDGEEASISPVNLGSIRPFLVFRERVDSAEGLEELASRIEARVAGGTWAKPPVVRVSLSSARLDPRDVKDFQDALRDSLGQRVLKVFVRLRRLDEKLGEAEVSIEPKIDVEKIFGEIIPAENVRRLAIEIYRLYLEGKGSRELIRELERIYEGWAP